MTFSSYFYRIFITRSYFIIQAALFSNISIKLYGSYFVFKRLIKRLCVLSFSFQFSGHLKKNSRIFLYLIGERMIKRSAKYQSINGVLCDFHALTIKKTLSFTFKITQRKEGRGDLLEVANSYLL